MHYYSLREFIDRLDREGELVRIRERVSPILEIAEITDRVSKSPGGGPALLFENVENSSLPVLINAFGSRKRMNLALGVNDVESIARDIDRFLHVKPPSTLMDKVKLFPLLLEAAQFPPKRVPSSSAPCQEVVHLGDAVDLNTLPILQCWPQDAGRFITFPIVINRDAEGNLRNVGLYRMQVFDSRTTAMHWHIHKDGAHFFHEYRRRKQTMEVAVALGADPAVCYSASAPLPYGVDEFLLAGFIRKTSVPLVPCKTVDLEVPATAEIVLEGYIDPSELRLEGPFGDHTGYYSQDGDYPVFHITALTHRNRPVYLTTLVGIPPQEDFYLGKATERIFLPLMRTQLPELVDMDMPLEGVFHNCVIVSIDKRYPFQARRLMSALWGMGQMSFVKTIVVVDADVEVHDYRQVAARLFSQVNFETDLYFAEGILDVLNHASDRSLYGSKLGIDATVKVPGEAAPADPPAAARNPEAVPPSGAVKNAFPEVTATRFLEEDALPPILFAALAKTRPHQGREFVQDFFKRPEFARVAVLVVLEGHVDVNHLSTVMWKLFNNLDPRRDLWVEGGRVGIDVTRKMPEEGYRQHWPEEIHMAPEIKTRVEQKWNLLFPGGNAPHA